MKAGEQKRAEEEEAQGKAGKMEEKQREEERSARSGPH